MTSSKVTGACDICKREFHSKSQHGLNCTLGAHKRLQHGIAGMTGRERYYVFTKGMTLEQAKNHIANSGGMSAAGGGRIPTPEADKTSEMAKAQRKKEYQKAYRLAHKNNNKPQQQNGSEAVFAKLSECPCCGAKFYYVKGQV